ncbi:hypothetical protein GWI33_004213 [Rhynchophorus ferrugineus]|uniref:Uncharacterized protein n=1 Tax=Rhynchophorus ferrugineus TaxID=354439 RepID=A0A834IZC1_RHYFE|nr:hypothetical protein GWI33_004213 [Rhynchophorus ferrugineus]
MGLCKRSRSQETNSLNARPIFDGVVWEPHYSNGGGIDLGGSSVCSLCRVATIFPNHLGERYFGRLAVIADFERDIARAPSTGGFSALR